jgi:crossover junction endodeoxyribonuclease RusA
VTIDLPEPPSVNKMWRRVGPRTILSKDGRAFKTAVSARAKLARLAPLAGPIALTLHWRRKHKRGDVDNRVKAVLDSLNGFAYHDDSQIVELHVYRVDDRANPGVTVTVQAA